MAKKIVICLAMCLVGVSIACAQSAKSARLEASWTADGALEVRFELGEWRLAAWQGRLAEVVADGMYADNAAMGTAALPTLSCVVELPQGVALGDGIATAASRADSVRVGCGLRRVQPPAVKDAEPLPDTAPAPSAAGPLLKAEPLGSLLGHNLWRLTASPFGWDAEQGVLRVFGRVEATSKPLPAAKSVAGGAPEAGGAERFMVVAPAGFAEALQPFVKWKRQCGYEMMELYVHTAQRDSVKAAMNALADSAGVPRYVLLVGDAEQLQAFLGTTRPEGIQLHSTDLYYANFGGNYLPEALLGRWPVRTVEELQAVVDKTLRYEQCAGADTAALGRVLLVAGKETSQPAPTTTNGQVNYLAARFAESLPGVDTVCYRNPASGGQQQDVLADIGRGTALVNYTAHCGNTGWTSPSVGFGSVDTLPDAFPTVYINNCCSSNNFSGTCFGEQLLRKPSGGAVGVIGATNSTLWNEDYYWAVGPKYPFELQPAFDPSMPGALEQMIDGSGRALTMGSLLVAGNLAVAQFGSPYDLFYWEIYCLLGDPSLMPYLGVPQPIALAPGALPLHAADECIVLTGTPHARVAAMQADTLLGTVRLDGSGRGTLALRRPLGAGPVLLTATAFGHLPRTDTLQALAAPRYGVQVSRWAVADTAVCFTLHNPGPDTLRRLTVRLQPAAAGGPEVQADSLALLPAGADTSCCLPLRFAAGRTAQWEAALLLCDSVGDTVAWQRVWQDVQWTPGMLALRVEGIGGEAASSLVAGQEYKAIAWVEGAQADSLALRVTLWPDSLVLTGADTVRFAVGDSLTLVRVDASALRVDASALRGGLRAERTWWLQGGRRTDSFEEGFASHPWQRGSLRPWVIDEEKAHRGHLCARSAPIGGRQTSDLGLILHVVAPDSVAFFAAVSSESGYDKFLFSIDDTTRLALSGERGWQRYAFPLEAGSHRLRWRYLKDDTRDQGSDCAWIDDVRLPLALWDSACGFFGPEPLLGVGAADGAGDGVAVYPNPSAGPFSVLVPADATLTLMDALGRACGSWQAQGGVPLLVGPTAGAGLYVLRVQSARGVSVHKIIITANR